MSQFFRKTVGALLFLLTCILCFSCTQTITDFPAVSGTENDCSDTDKIKADTENNKMSPTETNEKRVFLRLNGKPLSDCQITYAPGPWNGVSDLMNQDTEYDRITAERLASLLKEKYGVELPVKSSETPSATGREILVGKTEILPVLPLGQYGYLGKAFQNRYCLMGAVKG